MRRGKDLVSLVSPVERLNASFRQMSDSMYHPAVLPPLCKHTAAQISPPLGWAQTPPVRKDADRSQSSLVVSSSHPLTKTGAFMGTRLFIPESEQLPELLTKESTDSLCSSQLTTLQP